MSTEWYHGAIGSVHPPQSPDLNLDGMTPDQPRKKELKRLLAHLKKTRKLLGPVIECATANDSTLFTKVDIARLDREIKKLQAQVDKLA